VEGRKGEKKKSDTEKKDNQRLDKRRRGESSPIHGCFSLRFKKINGYIKNQIPL
jgi:hypothetical protein